MSGEKTEKPTRRRIRKARQQGLVANSALLRAGMSMVGAGVLLLLSVRWLGQDVVRLWPAGTVPDSVALDGSHVVLPVLKAALLASAFPLAGALILNPFLVRRPSVARYSPSFPRVREGIARGGAAVLLLVLMGVGWYSFFWERIIDPRGGAGWWLSLYARMAWGLVVAGALAVAVGGIWAHRSHLARLMMSRQEIREEFREMEGSPQMRSERRRRMRP